MKAPLRFPIAGSHLRVEVVRFRRSGPEPAACVVTVWDRSELVCRLDVEGDTVAVYEASSDESRRVYGPAGKAAKEGGKP